MEIGFIMELERQIIWHRLYLYELNRDGIIC